MRIVSVCPSLTELVFALDAGDELVGITTYCTHPAERVATVEKIGGTKNPDVARIVALAPDLVLLNEEENRREDAEALAAAGLRCLSTFPCTVAETAEMVRNIGTAIDRAQSGEAIASDIERRADRIRTAASGRPKVRFAYLIWRKPWMAAGSDTYVDALLSEAGGTNVFGSLGERYPKVTTEDLTGADPELVLLSSEPFPFRREHARELAELTGLSPDRFLMADGEALSWHGSRTPTGLDYAERCVRAKRG
jgi:ABC-type Fe3+-hydroxamate transport system substrate-binding protein